MTITVLFFASLREALGTAREELELPAQVGTIGQLRAHLRERGPVWAQALGEGRAVRMALNQVMASSETPIPPRAEVAFFPPVTGG